MGGPRETVCGDITADAHSPRLLKAGVNLHESLERFLLTAAPRLRQILKYELKGCLSSEKRCLNSRDQLRVP